MKLFIAWLAASLVRFVSSTANLTLPISANCGDQAVLTCTSTACDQGYRFIRDYATIYNYGGPQNVSDPSRYSATVTSASQVLLTITNITLSDVRAYQCACGFDESSAQQTLRYECRANKSSAEVTSNKELQITVDRLYPQPSGIVTNLDSSISQLLGMFLCGSSLKFTSHYKCTWNSTASLPDGYHTYNIMVTTVTQSAPVTGSFKIVTPMSPTISSFSTISNNRQVVRGVQDTLLTIQCVSQGGIPAPTLAWYRGNTSTSPLTLSNSLDSVQQSDGTYTVTLIHRFTARRTDDMTTFLCRVFYPGATTGASPDPSPASALLYLDLKPDTTTISQKGEAVAEGNMTLRCTSNNGRPAPNITWSYQGQNFTPTNNLSYDQTSETYTVISELKRPVNATDNGHTVKCMVSHTTLSIPLNAVINVDVKFGSMPGTVVISGNKTTPATGTNTIRLNCTSGSSNPASNITWYNGSDVIPSTENNTRWPGDNNGMITSAILTITPTRYMDGNRITCRPENGYKSDSTYVDLDILYSPLIKQLTNVTAIEGEPDVKLTCSASSNPPANFTWYNGNMVLSSGTGTIIDNSFSYVIPRVDRTDAKSYKCQAGNNVGRPDLTDMYLVVKYPPTVTVSTNTSPTYNVLCTAEGYPDNYTYHDWVQIWPGYGPVATIPFTGTTLTLTDVTYESSGVYVCSASNGIAVYDTNVTYMQGNASVVFEAPPVLTFPSPGGTRVPVKAILGQNATIEIKYWSNLNGSVVSCYKLVNDSRLSSSSCFVKMTNTEVILPVYHRQVKERGTLATLTIPIDSKEDLTDYDVVVTNRVPGKSVLGIIIVPQDKVSPAVESHSALIPGIVTGVCVPLVIVVVVIIICKWRKAGGKKTTENGGRNLGNASASSDSVVECAMYESAGHVQQPTPVKKTDQAALYAEPVKRKKELTKPATHKGESEYSEATVSFRPSKPKKNINEDGLVYADLEFNNNPKKSTIHGLDNATTYVQVDFTKAADPLPDSDEEI